MQADSKGAGRRLEVAIVFVAVLVAIAVAAARLAAFARAGTFAYDECFHATISEWIALRRAIPREIPGLYGGLFYYYQPLLNLLGAAVLWVIGPVGLHVLPAALWTATALALLFGAPREIPAEPRAWAAALVVMNGALAATGTLLYVEGLTTLLFVLAALAWARWRAAPSLGRALVLGAVLGLALLAKFTAWIAVGAVALAAL